MKDYIEIHDEQAASAKSKLTRRNEVPDVVLHALTEAIAAVFESNDGFRSQVTDEVAKRMPNWRFCSCYRHENSPLHALILALCSTVSANYKADGLTS